MTKYVVVAGGVISGVGKGVTTASLGRIFKERGFSTTIIKIDPYINTDAGTMRPTEHGEVWVTQDGGEVDQDLGTYERFIDQAIPRKNSITTGQVYHAVIERERAGEYLGQTVQCIPHIPLEVVRRIKEAAEGYDIALIEIGGVIGDYENTPFLSAVKLLERDLGASSVAYVLVTYLLHMATTGEWKTKPTQHAIRTLRQEGIAADIVVCRAPQPFGADIAKKIESMSYISADHIIAAPDAASIYEVPLQLKRAKADQLLLSRLGLEPKCLSSKALASEEAHWERYVAAVTAPRDIVRIALVGKYRDQRGNVSKDSYLSIEHALMHAGAQSGVGVSVQWLDAYGLWDNPEEAMHQLEQCQGIIVPGGFGPVGVEGKVRTVQYARMNNIPLLGICYGLQLAVVEYARNVCGLDRANTTEVDPATPHPVVDLLPAQRTILHEQRYGGTMRLGPYDAQVIPGSRVEQLYDDAGRTVIDMITGATIVTERHRHRYEVNPAYIARLEEAGMVCSGHHTREDGARLVEFIELPEHRFFVATQAHPEFMSRMGNPSPLFMGLVQAAVGAK